MVREVTKNTIYMRLPSPSPRISLYPTQTLLPPYIPGTTSSPLLYALCCPPPGSLTSPAAVPPGEACLTGGGPSQSAGMGRNHRNHIFAPSLCFRLASSRFVGLSGGCASGRGLLDRWWTLSENAGIVKKNHRKQNLCPSPCFPFVPSGSLASPWRLWLRQRSA